jgi:hypothetical protein
VFAAAGIVMFAAAGTFIYLRRRAYARHERLMKGGVTIPATVFDIRQSRIVINRRTRWCVVYRYEYPKGRQLEGESEGFPAEDVWGLKPGDQVQIKVDPQKPENSLFLGQA